MDNIALEARGIDFAYYNGLVLKGIDLRLQHGELVTLIGPNGSGKTTLLKLLCGLLPPKRGRVELDGHDIARLSRREIARHIAMVPQELVMPFSFTVWEMVMLGRTPHVRPLVGEGERDHAVVRQVMHETNLTHLAERPFTELSGGERQRVIVAMALAQEPQVLLLDEPTVHLDISHQVEILDLVRRLNRERGLTVLATMHDLNLAALYFDWLVLLDQGRVAAEGTPAQVLRADYIAQVFRAAVEIQPHPTRPVPHVVVLPNGC